MDNLRELVDFIDSEIKDNVKEMTYIKLLNIVSKIAIEKGNDIERIKDELDYCSDDPEGNNDIYGSY